MSDSGAYVSRGPADLVAGQQGSVEVRLVTGTLEIELGSFSPQRYVDYTDQVAAYSRAACHVEITVPDGSLWTPGAPGIPIVVSAYLLGQASGVDAVLDQWGFPATGTNSPAAAQFMDTIPIVRSNQLVGGALRARYCPAELYRLRLRIVVPSNVDTLATVSFGWVANRGA